MNKYRVEKIGFGYYLQQYGAINYDGIPDYGWKDVARFDSEESAKEYCRVYNLYLCPYEEMAEKEKEVEEIMNHYDEGCRKWSELFAKMK